jgi:class 3 adenylate cyclase/pimeloyl-ACP methyl ester carboxylesterase
MSGVPETPTTRYARSGGVDIAYQVVGDAPVDFVFVPGWIWNLELAWELSEIARFFERLAQFVRVVIVEKRGVGLSDRVAGTPTLEERADDIRAVMDDAGIDHAAIGGWFDGAAMAATVAATNPERVSALVIGCMAARVRRGRTEAGSLDPEILDQIAQRIGENWGQASWLEVVAPSVAHDPRVHAFWCRFERLSATPNAAAALFRWNAEIDLDAVLPVIQAPTLVLNRANLALVPAASAQALASAVPNSRYVELPGREIYPFFGDSEPVVTALQEFLTGTAGPAPTDRALLTVAFTDIVGSTVHASELGDERWRDLLEAHRGIVRRLLERFDGIEIDTAGDGFLATFAGPARAIHFACTARDALREQLDLDIRAGLHTGEVERHADGIAGLAVHIAARVVGVAQPSEVLTTSTVKDLVLGSGIEFDDRGEHQLKGVPGTWRLFQVAD